jgi:hypothetical protein
MSGADREMNGTDTNLAMDADPKAWGNEHGGTLNMNKYK